MKTSRQMFHYIVFFAMGMLLTQGVADAKEKGRHVPSKHLPYPSTVSPEIQAWEAEPFNPLAKIAPKNALEWKLILELQAPLLKKMLIEPARALFPADVQEGVINGVKIYTITPASIPPENEERILIHLHGGGYVFFGGEGCLSEALQMAHYGKYKVIAVDYRMPPDHPFPAALDDSIAVYTEVLKTFQPKNIGLFGTSAGGGLTAATLLKIQELNLPFPGAVSLGTPWADLTKTGDTYFTNEDIDNVLITYKGLMGAAAKLYAGEYDLRDPLLSPIYGEYTQEFPPAILTSGTRDLFLSNTVRLYRKLRNAGVVAELQVFEGMPHAFYAMVLEAPESKEAFDEMVRFFNKHLGN